MENTMPELPPAGDPPRPPGTIPFDWACGVLLALLVLTSFVGRVFLGIEMWRHGSWELSFVLLGVATALDWEGDILKRLKWTVLVFTVWVLTTELLRRLSGVAPVHPRDMWYWTWFYKAWPQWLLTLWLASRFFESRGARAVPPGARVLTALLLLFCGWLLAGFQASHNPENSISHYRLDMGEYLAGLIVLLRLWDHGWRRVRWLLWVLAGGVAFQVLCGLAAIVIAHCADMELLQRLNDIKIIQFNETDPARRLADPSWRLLFPMMGHNALGAAMLAGFYILCLAFAKLPGSRWRWFFLTLTAPVLLMAVYSMTRGAVLAIFVGLLPLWIARSWKSFALVCVLGTLALALIPSSEGSHLRSKWAHLSSILKKQTWTDPNGSIGKRVCGWHGALLMMRDHPLTGVGYSPVVFKEVYMAEYKARTGDMEDKVHSHNVFLEFGAEGGAPALALFLALMFYRWSWFWRAMRVNPQDSALLLLLGLETALLLFNQFFFMFKGNQGLLFWFLLLGSTLYCVEASGWNSARSSVSDVQEKEKTAARETP